MTQLGGGLQPFGKLISRLKFLSCFFFVSETAASCCQIPILLFGLLARVCPCAFLCCCEHSSWHIQRETFNLTAACGLLRSSQHGRIWRCRWRPSTAGCHRTLLGWEHTGNPCNWASRRPPTLRSPPGWSCSGWSMCAGRRSRCCSCSSGPGISSPQKK